MIAELVSGYRVSKTCDYCFKKTRENIVDFFEYLDCDKDSLINAEDIHVQTRTILETTRIKNAFETLTVNDFVLKAEKNDLH